MSRNKWKLLRATSHSQRFFQQNCQFILALFFFNDLTVSWSLLRNGQYEVSWIYGFSLLLGITLLAALLQLVRYSWLRRALQLSLLVPSGLFFCLEAFAVYNYKALLGAGIINALLETNSQEALEFSKMYIGWHGMALLALSAAGLFAVRRCRLPVRSRISRRRQSRLVLGLLFLCLLASLRLGTAYMPLLAADTLDLPVLRVYAATRTAIRNINTYKDLEAKVSTDIDLRENQSNIPNIVFILGEATNRNYMHLYGYRLPNTPNLDELNAKNEIAVFSDTISAHSITTASLKVLFTFCDYESDKEWYTYHNLMDVMNSAGYKTHWLSNQESFGIWGNVAQIFAKRSAVHEFTRLRDSHEDFGSLDEELLPLLDKALAQREAKNFYVLHLMGGHGAYYSRYPYAFAKFQPEDIRRDVSDEKKLVIAQYTNALYYNDYIVSSIFDKFRGTEALVIYLPDHGETVYDDSSLAGHVEENPNRHMLEVPLIIWASDSFKARHPEKWAAIQAAVNEPYMTDDMIHTVLDIADVKPAEFDPAKSIVNPAFESSRPRLNQGRNYDTDIRPDKK